MNQNGLDQEEHIRFIILTTQRSGSTWLVDLLNQVPDLTVYGEMLTHKPRNWFAGASEYPGFVKMKLGRFGRFFLFKYLNGLYQRPGTVGFKLHYTHVKRYPEMLFYLFMKKIYVVHLIRKNPLDVVISTARVKQTGQGHLVKDGKENKQGRITDTRIFLDPNKILSQMKRHQCKIWLFRTVVSWLKLAFIEVFYEDISRDPSNFHDLFTFLNINQDVHSLSSNTMKIVKGKPADVISNYPEIQKVLTGTPFECFLK